MGWVQYRCDLSVQLFVNCKSTVELGPPRTAPTASGHSPILGANFGPSGRGFGWGKEMEVGR